MMKVAMLIPDNRDEFRAMISRDPVFGPAPMALLEGMAQESGLRRAYSFHSEKTLQAPEKSRGEYFISFDAR